MGAVFFLIMTLLVPNLVNKTTQKVGVVGKYTTETLPNSILSLISQGLTSVDKAGVVTPSLATSWQSPDGGMTWIFTIDENAYWQDEKKVESDDLNYEFSDAEVNIIDKDSIEFKLQTPFSAFPVVLSKPVFKKGLLGTGEWKVKHISLIGGNVNKLTLQDKTGNKKVFIFYPTEERLKLGFKLGEIDYMQNIFEEAPFDKWKTVSVEKILSKDHLVEIFFNTEDPMLNEKTVRQALNYAIKKDQFESQRAISPISDTSWAYNPQVKPYEKDGIKAKELLNNATDLKIILSTSVSLLPIAEKIKSDWEEIGVETEIQVVTGVPQNYQAFLATVDVPKDPDQYVLWHSTQQTNISRYKNPRIDKLLEDGRTELDVETRKKTYLDFQRFLVEDSPAIFLYHPTFYTVTRK